MSRPSPLVALLKNLNIEPWLVDIGSSGFAQQIFQGIAGASNIVGFDADARGQDLAFCKGFKNGKLFGKAVIPGHENTAQFVLTESPACSSLLEPDIEALKSYEFADLFMPKKRVQVPAMTLNDALREIGIDHFDWIKVDSQGLDKSILKSLNAAAFSKLLAVDIEPGVIPAYKGEDTFAATHEFLVANGFWLANLNMQRYARISKNSLLELERISDVPNTHELLKKSPTACEGRYLRTNEHLDTVANDKRSLLLTAVFALTDDLIGYAFEALTIYKKHHGEDRSYAAVLGVITSQLRETAAKAKQSKSATDRLKAVIPPKAKQLVKEWLRN